MDVDTTICGGRAVFSLGFHGLKKGATLIWIVLYNAAIVEGKTNGPNVVCESIWAVSH